jgi:cell division protein FtsZ
MDEIRDHLTGAHMVFITAGMGGGTGTGAAPVIARAAREQGILTVGVVTKPFHFEGQRRMRTAEHGIIELQKSVDTLIVIPNQNLFRVANEKTTFADAFAMADQVLYSGVACITDLMVKEGLINLDFADVRAVMRDMGKAMMGTGEADRRRGRHRGEAAIANPLLDETSMKGARGLLISITGGNDLTLFEVDEAATRIREEVDPDANIIVSGATFDRRDRSKAPSASRWSRPASSDVPLPAHDFIPPAAEKPMRPVRMPTADELPRVVRDQIRSEPVVQQRAVDNPVEKKRTSLMEKLQSIGFTRKADAEPAPAPMPRAVQPVQPARAPAPPACARAGPADAPRSGRPRHPWPSRSAAAAV